MTARRVIGIGLLGAGLGLLAAAGIGWQKVDPAVSEIRQERASLEASLDTTRANLRKASLRFQGFQANMDAVPDTVRRFGGGIIMEQSRIYRKTILTLEADEDRDVRRLNKLAAREAEAQAERRRKALPLGVGGAVLALAGTVTLAGARRRGVAA